MPTHSIGTIPIYLCASITGVFYRCFNSRQLPVPTAVHVAKVLEHQPEPRAQPTVQRARSAQVVETRDDGRGHTVRAQRGLVAVTGRSEVRHTISNVRAVRQSGTQLARSLRRWWRR